MQPRPTEKILVLRLSSIGDIVLCTPILRSLRACKPHAEIHFLTKRAFTSLLSHNPHIDKVIPFDGDLNATVAQLRAEGYTHLLDLHRNIRSRLVALRLGIRTATYPKDRLPVLLYTRLRIGRLPSRHTVERYGAALQKLGCTLDHGPLEFPVPEEARLLASQWLARHFNQAPVAIALGGNFATKRWPREHFLALIDRMKLPVVLLGGKAEQEDAAWIAAQASVPCVSAAGAFDLVLSAALMAQSRFAITHDSGFMHIGCALGIKLFSLWGSTVPEIGFAPYRAPNAHVIQLPDLACRPCSKLGHDQCPKGHFKCMRDLLPETVHAQLAALGAFDPPGPAVRTWE